MRREKGATELGRLSLATGEGDLVGLPEGTHLIGGNLSQRQEILRKSF